VNAWLWLFGAGVLEVGWAVGLKHTGGWTRLWPSVAAVAAAVASLLMLSHALKSLPAGTAYAVWVGVGAVGVAAVGILWLGESAAPARLLSLALIVAGIVGLKVVES
jgi:quaternary ammonium compound-resistance protein SugE